MALAPKIFAALADPTRLRAHRVRRLDECLLPHRERPTALLFAALAFGLISFGKLPLPIVVFGLVPISIGVVSLEKTRTP